MTKDMKQRIKTTLENWAHAYKLASENTKLLLDWSQENSNICVQRMKDLDIAEKSIINLAHENDIPIELVNYICAKINMEWCKCHLSSYIRDNYHIVCKNRSENYFKSREKLFNSIYEATK